MDGEAGISGPREYVQGVSGYRDRNLGAGLDPDTSHEVDGEVRGQLELPEKPAAERTHR